MKKKPRISRETLWSLCQPVLPHPFTLPGNDLRSSDDDIALSHVALAAGIALYLDAAFEADAVANILRGAADQADKHSGGEFNLSGREDADKHREIAHAHMFLDKAINVRFDGVSEPLSVGNWLRDAADAIAAQQPRSSALASE